MSLRQLGFGGLSAGSVTQTAGTVIQALLQPNKNGITRISRLRYNCGTTAHTITILRCLGTTTVASAAATGQAVVNLTADPGNSGNGIAGNDLVAIRSAATGVTRLYKVSSVSTLAITMTANMGEAYSAGDKVWFFGVTTDVDPKSGSAHPTIAAPASTLTDAQDDVGGVCQGWAKDEPLVVNSDNATAAGTLQLTAYAFTPV